MSSRVGSQRTIIGSHRATPGQTGLWAIPHHIRGTTLVPIMMIPRMHSSYTYRSHSYLSYNTAQHQSHVSTLYHLYHISCHRLSITTTHTAPHHPMPTPTAHHTPNFLKLNSLQHITQNAGPYRSVISHIDCAEKTAMASSPSPT